MSPPFDWSGFHVAVDEVLVVAPCMEFVLYLDTTDDAGILDFYQRGRTALGAHITHYQAESMKGFSRLNPRGESMVPTWFTRPRADKSTYYIALGGSDSDESVSADTIELSIFRRPAQQITTETKAKWKVTYEEKGRKVPHPGSLLRVTLSLEHPLAQPEKFRAWVADFSLVKTGSVFTGHCGYALNHYMQAARPNLYGPAKTALASLVLRYPGLGWNGGAVQARVLRYQPELTEFIPLIKRANWVNLVCDKTLDCFGGRAHVRNQLATDLAISVEDLEHGLAIHAGPTPQIGDLGHRDFLPLYRQLAKVLRPVRIPDLDGLGAGFMQAATNEWLNAFDKEYR